MDFREVTNPVKGRDEFKGYTGDSVEKAQEKILEVTHPLGSVLVPLHDALGSVLSEDVLSPHPLPTFHTCLTKGYAVNLAHAATQSSATPLTCIQQHVHAGTDLSKASIRISHGETIRVAAGAPLPIGADAVLEVGQVREAFNPGIPVDDSALPDTITILNPNPSSNGVRSIGSDVQMNTTILPEGHVITATSIGVLASIGVFLVRVVSQPSVGIVSVGDELVNSGGPLNLRCKVRSAARAILAAQFAQVHVAVHDFGIVPEWGASIDSRVATALRKCDVVMVLGRCVANPDNAIRSVVENLGPVIVGRVNITHAQHAMVSTAAPSLGYAVVNNGPTPGIRTTAHDPRFIFSMPNDVCTVQTLTQLLVVPCVKRMQGYAAAQAMPCTTRAVVKGGDITQHSTAGGNVVDYHKVSLQYDMKLNTLTARSTGYDQSPSKLIGLLNCNGLMKATSNVVKGNVVKEGTVVDVVVMDCGFGTNVAGGGIFGGAVEVDTGINDPEPAAIAMPKGVGDTATGGDAMGEMRNIYSMDLINVDESRLKEKAERKKKLEIEWEAKLERDEKELKVKREEELAAAAHARSWGAPAAPHNPFEEVKSKSDKPPPLKVRMPWEKEEATAPPPPPLPKMPWEAAAATPVVDDDAAAQKEAKAREEREAAARQERMRKAREDRVKQEAEAKRKMDMPAPAVAPVMPKMPWETHYPTVDDGAQAQKEAKAREESESAAREERTRKAREDRIKQEAEDKRKMEMPAAAAAAPAMPKMPWEKDPAAALAEDEEAYKQKEAKAREEREAAAREERMRKAREERIKQEAEDKRKMEMAAAPVAAAPAMPKMPWEKDPAAALAEDEEAHRQKEAKAREEREAAARDERMRKAREERMQQEADDARRKADEMAEAQRKADEDSARAAKESADAASKMVEAAEAEKMMRRASAQAKVEAASAQLVAEEAERKRKEEKENEAERRRKEDEEKEREKAAAQAPRKPAKPPPIPQKAPPAAVPPPIPQKAPPAAVPPPIPQKAPPAAVPPPIPQRAPPAAVPPPIPQRVPPAAVPPPIPSRTPPPLPAGGSSEDDEYMKLYGMTKEKFDAMPGWKQVAAKKKAGTF